MPSIPQDELLIIIFFFYGLAFYSMGLALFVESGRASELSFARSMRLLAGFGILHGIHEWIDMIEQGVMVYHHQPIYAWLQWFRLAILVTSFLALLLFGEQLLMQSQNRSGATPHLTIGAGTWYLISCIVVRTAYKLDDPAWLQAADVLARYVLGIPSGLLACWVLWRQRKIFRERGMDLFVRDLTIASVSMALYGIIGQFFTQPSQIFPSSILNSDLFFHWFGFPIQLFRATMAIMVAVSMIRVLQALEVESQQRIKAMEQARQETEALSREELARLNTELQIANKEAEHLLEEVQRRDAVRGELLQRITKAQESERQRIARELHDETGQALTGLALGLHGLAKQNKLAPEDLSRRLASLESIATESLGELRHLINDLRPPQLDDMGLAAALRWLVDRYQSQDKPQVKLDVQGTPYALPSEVETTLFRIAQEGLNNAIKHAQADHIWVTLDYDDGPTLTVRDDGRGFDPAAALSPNSMRASWGLIGIQERTNLINATLSLHSAFGEGTIFTVRASEPRKVIDANPRIDR